MSVNAAALLGIGGHVGQVRPGYAADLIAVGANPLADITALRDISLVVQAGRVIRDDRSARGRGGPVTATRRYTDASGLAGAGGLQPRRAPRRSVITVSGTTATGPDGAALCPGDTLGQARICLQRVLAAVAALGGQPGRRGAHRGLPGARRRAGSRPPGRTARRSDAVAPANTMLYVAGLIGDGFCVEVEAMAVAGE